MRFAGLLDRAGRDRIAEHLARGERTRADDARFARDRRASRRQHRRGQPRETGQRVLGAEIADAGIDRDVRQDIVRPVDKCRRIAVYAVDMGAEHIVAAAGHRGGVFVRIGNLARQTRHAVIVEHLVGLAFHEHPGRHVPGIARRRRHAQFVVQLRIDVLARIVLRGIKVVPLPVEERGIDRAQRVIGDGIGRIVLHHLRGAREIAAGIRDIPGAELALDRQRGLDPFVAAVFGGEVLHLQIAHRRIVEIGTVAFLGLVDQGGFDIPVGPKLDAQRDPATGGFGVVEVLLDVFGVRNRPQRDRIAVLIERGIRARAGHIADEPAIAFVERRGADRHALGHWHVDEAFDHTARRIGALAKSRAGHVETGLKLVRIGLLGDQAQRARQRGRAEQRALRARQRLDPLHVIDMQVGRAADRGQRDFVDVERAGRLRAGMAAVGIRTARHAAEIDLRLARPERLEADAGQQLGIIVKAGDLVFLQLLAAERLKADRHVLQVLRALLRGHHDLAVAVGFCRRSGRRIGGMRRARQHRPAQQRRDQRPAPDRMSVCHDPLSLLIGNPRRLHQARSSDKTADTIPARVMHCDHIFRVRKTARRRW